MDAFYRFILIRLVSDLCILDAILHSEHRAIWQYKWNISSIWFANSYSLPCKYIDSELCWTDVSISMTTISFHNNENDLNGFIFGFDPIWNNIGLIKKEARQLYHRMLYVENHESMFWVETKEVCDTAWILCRIRKWKWMRASFLGNKLKRRAYKPMHMYWRKHLKRTNYLSYKHISLANMYDRENKKQQPVVRSDTKNVKYEIYVIKSLRALISSVWKI